MESKGKVLNVASVSDELIRALTQPHKPDDEFEGKYHHMGFQWWTYDIWSSGFQASMLTHLEYVNSDELYDFVSQFVRRIFDKKQPKGEAVRALLTAAFGTKKQFEIKEE